MVFCCTAAQDDVRATICDHLPTPSEFEPTKARLKQMIIIGHTTPTTSKVWAKVPAVGTWSVILSTKKIGPNLNDEDCMVMTHHFEDGEDVLNHCFEFTSLDEDTKYYYVLVEGSGVDALQAEGPRPVIGGATEKDEGQEFFRTTKTKTDGVTFAAYSCHDPYSWEAGKAVEGAWPQLADVKDRLDLTIGGGDQVYVDSNEIAMTDLWVFLRDYMDQVKAKFITDGKVNEEELMKYLTQLIREYYQIYWNFPKLAEIHRRCPAYMMWDDHEIMDGWGSVNCEERIIKLKKKTQLRQVEDDELIEKMAQMTFVAASQVYNEYQHSHNPGPAFAPGVDDPKAFSWDFKFNRGDCHFYALDMRGAHNCETDANRLLGSEQHQRLKTWLDGLEAAGAKSAFLVIPVPIVHWSTLVEHAQKVIPSLKDDLMDGWGHPTNHVERAKLLKALFIASDKLKIPITVVSGDVHCASAYTLSDAKNYPNARILQVTSSSISRKPVGAIGTLAYAPTGLMQERLNDGKGKVVKTSIYQRQVFAKAGVNNFVVIAAKGGEVDVEFFWPSKDGSGVERAKVDLGK